MSTFQHGKVAFRGKRIPLDDFSLGTTSGWRPVNPMVIAAFESKFPSDCGKCSFRNCRVLTDENGDLLKDHEGYAFYALILLIRIDGVSGFLQLDSSNATHLLMC